MKILQITPRIPFPPRDGGAIGIYNITKFLHEKGHDVTLCAINTNKHFQKDEVMADICEPHSIFINTNISVFKAFINLFKSVPYNAERFLSRKFSHLLENILSEKKFDVVHFDSIFVAPYIHIVHKHTNAPMILRAHNVEYTIWKRFAESVRDPFKKIYIRYLADKMKNFESRYLKYFDGIAGITREDESRIRELGYKGKMQIIPAGVNTGQFIAKDSLRTLSDTLFILSSFEWMPNVEAALWFLEKVWKSRELGTKKFSQLSLHIAGKNMPSYFYKFNNERVKIYGEVESAEDFMQAHEVMLVPLFSGGGMRLKIVEAMAMKKAIISTSVGAEGIEYTDGKNILIADTPEKFTEQIERCVNDKNLVRSLGENARRLAEEKYEWSKIIDGLIEFYQTLNPNAH